MSVDERKKVPARVVFFAGKAAPGCKCINMDSHINVDNESDYMAKLVIRLIVNVARVINADAETNKYLEMFFLPDYSVSLAEILIPASDLSQHISTAGTEASGTSNMKFCLKLAQPLALAVIKVSNIFKSAVASYWALLTVPTSKLRRKSARRTFVSYYFPGQCASI
jgi:hypothetical protein